MEFFGGFGRFVFWIDYLSNYLRPRTFSVVSELAPCPRALFWMGPENKAWGWLAHFHSMLYMADEWEVRIGLGLLFGAFWIGITVYSLGRAKKVLSGNRASDTASFLPLGLELFEILAVLSVFVSMCFVVKIIHQSYLWELVYFLLPGAKALKCISRFFIFLTLPVSIVFSLEIQRITLYTLGLKTWKPKWMVMLLLGALLGGIGIEQVGGLPFAGYSKREDRQKIVHLSQMVPPDASAFYITLGADTRYRAGDYPQVDAMLVSIATGVPTINGTDSSPPPDWDLRLDEAGYQGKVRKWIFDHNLGPSIFNLEIDGVDYEN
jgi:hypothetical protein